jgi:hypothetical protein
VLQCVQVAKPFYQQDLLPLANLHSLQELTINSFNQSFLQSYMSAKLAAGLTALTRLELDGCRVSCLSHVSKCVCLKVLHMGCPDGLEVEMGPGDWAALGALTGLVELELLNAKFPTPTQECCAAMSKLTQLRSFGAWLWSAEMLPLLAAYTHLTELIGGWQQPKDSMVGRITLPSVVELAKAHGSPPFAALPNLVVVEQSGCMTADAFISMSQHCPRLRQLKTEYAGTSLSSDEDGLAHIPAIKALAALTGLTHLEFMVDSYSDLFVVIDVVVVLLPYGFRQLQLVVSRDVPMKLSALMHLARLQGLPELLLQVDAATADLMALDAAFVLSGLSGIRSVRITGLKSDDIDTLEVARRVLEEGGLPCPTSLHFTDMGHDIT